MKTLEKFKVFIDEINVNNSRNYKLSVLEKYKNDADIKYYLQYVFDPFIITGISTKTIDKIKHNGILSEWFAPFDVKTELEWLKNNNTGSNEVINKLGNLYNCFGTYYCELNELFLSVISKNLQLGVDSKSINKVMPGLIREFNVMLANKYFDKPEIVIGKSFSLTKKIDGMRCIMLKENGIVTFWSRQGQQIEGLVDLIKDAEQFPDNIALDGELVAMVDSPDTYKDTMKRARTKDAEKHGLKMKVFDYMPVADFKKQSCDLIYTDRRKKLESIFNNIKTPLDHYELLTVLYNGTDTNKIQEILKEQVSKGEEGIMINIDNAKYEFKRTNELLKVKLMKDLDLKVVDYFEGENSFAGTLGGFIVSYKGNNVKVGSGFSQEFREEAWKNPSSYIGKIITVQYFEETTNDNGGLSLRFPVFLDVRTDKTEPDF